MLHVFNAKAMDLIGFVCWLSSHFMCTWGRMDFGSLLVEQHLPDACLKNLRKLTGPWSWKLKRMRFACMFNQCVFRISSNFSHTAGFVCWLVFTMGPW